METKRGNARSLAAAFIGILALIVIDQLTKLWAIERLKDQPPIIWIKGVFELQYLENRGAAFGLFQNQNWLFLLSVILILILAGWMCYRLPAGRRYVPLRIIAAAVCAGAFGNAFDRIFRGYVVDFFYFSLIDFPIFNVADIYVTVSLFAFLFLFFFYYREEELECLFPGKEKGQKG